MCTSRYQFLISSVQKFSAALNSKITGGIKMILILFIEMKYMPFFH